MHGTKISIFCVIVIDNNIRVAMPPGEPGKHTEFQNSTKILAIYKFSLKARRNQGILSLTSFYHPKISELLNLCKKKNILVTIHVISLRIHGNTQITNSSIRGNPRIVHLVQDFLIIKIFSRFSAK